MILRWSKLSLLIIVLIFFMTGCASVKKDWEHASSVGNSSAYRAFLQQYPDSEYSADAKKRIEKLEWEKVQSSNSAGRFRDFLNKYPASQYSEEAQTQIEKLEWEQVESSIIANAFRVYIEKYPNSPYSTEAKARAADLDREEWERIKNDNNVHRFRNFLWGRPGTELASEVNAKIAAMARDAWKKTILENKAYLYKKFLQDFPDCEFSPKALSNLEQLEAHKAVIAIEVPEILSPGDHFSIVFKETNGVGVVFKEKQYLLVCDTGVYRRQGTELVESDWIKVPPNGEAKHNTYIPWGWNKDNCSEVKNAWFGGYDDNGNYIEVPYSYRIKVK